MTNLQKEIINIISDYASKNPNQRFGQLLFNLDITILKTTKMKSQIFIMILTKKF